jgi:hypothetical protein
MKKRHRKLVKLEIITSHFKPINGNKNAPDKLLATKDRLLTLQRKAKEVASRSLIVFLAIKSMTMIKMNIPIRL